MQQCQTVAIVGVGLIGGSIGLALKQRGLAGRVIGVGRNPARLQQALDRGAVCSTTTDLSQGAAQADIVVICTPVDSIPSFVHQCAQACHPSCWITDAGSIKTQIVEEVERLSPQARFVGSHPMAGSEKSGVAFADADLFIDRPVVVTPSTSTAPELLDSAERFWRQLGGKVMRLSPQDHDQTAAFISHLPHVAASALAAATPQDCLSLSAGGWRDTTRIAAADVELWRQILASNRKSVLHALDQFVQLLREFQSALAQNDPQALQQLLQQGKEKRDALGD